MILTDNAGKRITVDQLALITRRYHGGDSDEEIAIAAFERLLGDEAIQRE